MPLAYREMSQPVAEPVTLAQAKSQLRVDFSEDDLLIQGYIVASRQMVEKMMNRSIFNRKMRLTLDYFPWPGWETVTGSSHDSYLGWYFRSLSIRLPKPATASVDQVSYIDNDLEPIVIDPSNYVVDLISEPARIFPAPGFTWPYQNQYIPGQVVIDFTSGTYGDGADENTCPQTIWLAILLLVSHFYSNREASSAAALKTIPLGVAELLAGEVFESVC
jgi:uncharacterized phiE125 gp8 family phage protein